MKTTIISMFFALASVLNSCIKVSDGVVNFSPVSYNEGKGAVIEKTYSPNFNSIEVTSGIDAEIFKSTIDRVVVSAPSDILERILVVNTGNNVKISVKPMSNISTKYVKVKIYTNDLVYLEANSSADIVVKDTFTEDKISTKVSSSGEIQGNLEANNLQISAGSSGSFSGKVWAVNADFSASSSGDISITGKVQNGRFQASSSGDIIAENVDVKIADLQASSSGSISAKVSEKATAQASSSGDISIFRAGNPVISRIESSSGSVYIK